MEKFKPCKKTPDWKPLNYKKKPDFIVTSDIIAMGSEPLPNITPDEFRKNYGEKLSEKELAEAFALSSNQFFWVADDIDDYELGTEQYKNALAIAEAWGNLMDYYQLKIFAILVTEGVVIPAKGQISVLSPFMERNGYLDGAGWWYKSEKLECL